MTEGCTHKVKTRGVCTKCYSTLRVLIQKGKITWDGAVAAKLCLAAGEGSNLSPIQAAIHAAEEAGRLQLGESMPTPQLDPDQEPPPAPEPVAPAAPVAPPGYYYDANFQLVPIPKVQMPQIDETPQGYAAYDPNAPAAADVPHQAVPRETPAPEPVDPMDDLEDELYMDDETPEQKARRQAIERRHRREQEARYIEENGIQPPKGGNVVVVPPPKVNVEKNGEIITGHGAGPAEGLNIQPGIYIQHHDQPAQQTIDGEPLLPGWQIAPDGVNLINPQGQLVDTTPRAPAGQPAPPPQAPVLPTPNAAPQNAQLITPSRATGPAQPAYPQADGQQPWVEPGPQPSQLILPPNAQGAPAPVVQPPWEDQ